MIIYWERQKSANTLIQADKRKLVFAYVTSLLIISVYLYEELLEVGVTQVAIV